MQPARIQVATVKTPVRVPRAIAQNPRLTVSAIVKHVVPQAPAVRHKPAHILPPRSRLPIVGKPSPVVQRNNHKPTPRGPVRTIYQHAPITKDSERKIRALKGLGAGKLLVIVGNGPSVAEVPLRELRGHPNIDTMSINKPSPEVWPTTYWLFCDPSQYSRNVEIWNDYHGTVINSAGVRQQKDNTLQVKNIGGTGYSLDLSTGFHIGRSSVYAAMQVGSWMGYDKVYILGCDMAAVDGKLWFYGQNPDVTVDNRIKRFNEEARHYQHAADTMPECERARFIFCSGYLKYPFADKFGKISHIGAIERILEHAQQLRQRQEAKA